jgi:anti-sigma factor RsiW
MQCQKHKDLLERWWNDRLSEAERAELEAQLAECEDCRRELEGSRELWELMAYMPVPEPSGGMQAQFNAMLEGYKATEVSGGKVSGIAALWQLFTIRPALAAVFSGVLLLGGFGLGLMINRQKTVMVQAPAGPVAVAPPGMAPSKEPAGNSETVPVPTKQALVAEEKPSAEGKQLEALTAQVHEMREIMMLSLLQNPAASERLRAVSYTSEIRHVNPNIAAALLATLNNDPNVNVRLTTLEALTHFARDPVVREGLIQSILQQDSPLVQAALADVMLKLQEKRAILPFKKLLQQKDLNGMVRTKIEQTITRLT